MPHFVWPEPVKDSFARARAHRLLRWLAVLVTAAAALLALMLAAEAREATDQYEMRELAPSPPPTLPRAAAIAYPARFLLDAPGGGRPPFCPPRRWCGCWLQHHFGLADRALWRARAWARIGAPAPHGCVGCVAVLSRGARGGHVGIVQGYAGDDPIILSGNHNNAVGVGVYSRARVIAYRWVR
jgi:hypothetical protein